MTDARARPTLRRSRFKKYCKARAARAPRSSVGPRHGQAAVDTQCPRCDRGQHRACLRLRTCTARRSPGQASAARERQVFREEGVPVVPVILDVDTPPDASSSQATWEDREGVFRAPQMVGDRRVCVDAPHVLGFTCAAAAPAVARRLPPPDSRAPARLTTTITPRQVPGDPARLGPRAAVRRRLRALRRRAGRPVGAHRLAHPLLARAGVDQRLLPAWPDRRPPGVRRDSRREVHPRARPAGAARAVVTDRPTVDRPTDRPKLAFVCGIDCFVCAALHV